MRELQTLRYTLPRFQDSGFAAAGVPEDIQEALGQSISQAPFVKALAAAERYVVVRNRSAAAVLGALAHSVIDLAGCQ